VADHGGVRREVRALNPQVEMGCYPYVGDSQKGPEELKDAAGP
jgi:hypothetical protein